MYLFFLVFLIFISFCLNFFILLQPGKHVSNIMHSNISNNIKLFNNFRSNSFTTNCIGLCACLFLIISLILCNINAKKINSSFFDDHHDDVNQKILNVKENKILNTDIPN